MGFFDDKEKQVEAQSEADVSVEAPESEAQEKVSEEKKSKTQQGMRRIRYLGKDSVSVTNEIRADALVKAGRAEYLD